MFVGPGQAIRMRLDGWVAILGGLLWLVVAELRNVSLTEPIVGVSYEQFGLATPLAAVLLLTAMQGVHRLHRSRDGRLEHWGYRLATLGFSLLVFGLVLDRWLVGERSPPATRLRLLYLAAYLLAALGLVLFGVAAVRARVLPFWARPLPILIGPALFLASVAPVAGLDGLLWAALGVGMLLTPLPAWAERGRPALSLRAVGGAFLSRATLISGVLAVGVWSLEWSWIVGILVVLLLYAHEIGHVLAAFWRDVEVKTAPMFLPGFGAFVETAPGASAWDDAWISLGGPLFGGWCALAVKLEGIRFGVPELAHAGDFALIVNLLNLAPFSLLDGGRVARSTGWLGVLLTIGLGIFLLIQGVGLLLSVMIILGGVQAIATVRQTRSGLATHIGIFGVYLVSVATLLGAYVLSGQVQWLASSRPSWLPSLDTIFEVVFWTYLAGIVALPFAWRPGQSALVRYGIAALIGWPTYLLQRKLWMIVVSFALLGEALGLPGAEWTRRYAGSLARGGDPAAGAAVAYAFDALVHKGEPHADSWLESLRPMLAAGGEAVTSAVAVTLEQLGYERSASAWRPTVAPTGPEEEELAAPLPGILPSNVNSDL